MDIAIFGFVLISLFTIVYFSTLFFGKIERATFGIFIVIGAAGLTILIMLTFVGSVLSILIQNLPK